jgi:suppressor for copper-sensitivity B
MGRYVTKLMQLFGAAAVLVLGGAPADAADASAWARTPQTEVRLIAGQEGAGPDGAVALGLHFKLKDGWKVYWRRPGDAGFPPRIDWSESENLKDTDFAWPAPVRFQVLGFQTMGYAKEVVFPITARLADPKRPLNLRAHVDYLTCDDICIPYRADLALEVAAGGGAANPHAALIERFAARVPGDGSDAGLALERVETAGPFTRVDEQARDGAVRIVASSTIPFARPDVFIEGPELAFFGPPSARFSEGGRRAVLTVPVTLEKDAEIARETLRITLTDGERAAERELTVTAGGPAAMPNIPAAAPPIGFILLLALAGGALLNLMPCVLPVLSLKLVSFASLGGQPPRRVRASFLATAAGIVASFAIIATALVALKGAGAAIGWGIQFQHPWFIAALAVLATLFACNLWGLFQVPLPGWLGGVGVHGMEDEQRSRLAGDFATGVLATLLATPCSAPFLGTAVGFALAGAAGDIYAVFAGLGLGMALPYLVCAAVPGFARLLPRPGPWMLRLKQVLAFALAATVVWLLTVLAAQQDAQTAQMVAVLIAIIVVLLALPRLPAPGWRRAVAGGIVAASAAAVALPALVAPAPVQPDARRAAKSTAAFWQPFDPAAIPALVAQGKTVLVDITADWCITCQVNKVAVLERAPVKTLLASEQVVAMRGDWTRPSAEIAAYLQSFGRYAIPFDAVYGPGLPDGVPLSELLTTSAVLDALSAASNGAVVERR